MDQMNIVSDNNAIIQDLNRLCIDCDKNMSIVLAKKFTEYFGDYECIEVKYNENTDKSFFGIVVKPIGYEVKDLIEDPTNSFKFRKYSIEIDGKLFSNGLDCEEVFALMVYDIANIMSKSSIEKFRSVFEYYVGASNTILNYEKVVTFDKLFKLVMEESIRIITSCINKRSDEVDAANDFIKGLGLFTAYNNAIDKICKLKNSVFMNELHPNLSVLQWYLCIVNDLSSNSRDITMSLRDALSYTSSKLVKVSIINAINEIEPMTDTIEKVYRSLTEATKRGGLFTQIKQNGLRSIEEDIYEYSMRVKNAETEYDAINLMRLLNSRITILDDYLTYEDVTDVNRDRYSKVLDKYLKLREELSRKAVYKQKMYGLFVDYNALQAMADRGQLDTYY